MKITRRKRSKRNYIEPSVRLIELESTVPVLAGTSDGGSGAKSIDPQEGGMLNGDMDSNLNFVGDTLGY